MKKFSLLVAAIFIYSNLFTQGQIINVPADQPTIQSAINASVNGDTVLVSDGTYFENINFNGKAITVASHFLVDGDDSHVDNTIIDGSKPVNPNNGSVVVFLSGEDTTSVICGFTITGGSGGMGGGHRSGGGIAVVYSGAKVIHNKIINNYIINSASVGGGVFVYKPSHSCLILNNVIAYNEERSTTYTGGGGGIHIGEDRTRKVVIMNNYIAHNKSSSASPNGRGAGGGIDLNQSNSIIRNNIIVYNESYQGGGLDILDGNFSNGAIIENNTISYNHATSEFGGGVLDGADGDQYPIRNCIIWGNTAGDNLNQISKNIQDNDIVVEYSSVQAGYEGIGNIDLNPIFQDSISFYLESSSPCVDSGNPDDLFYDVEDENNTGYGLFPALGGFRNDMGAFGGPYSKWPFIEFPTDIKSEDNRIPKSFHLSQNYPNPFNPTTKIQYSIVEKSLVTIKVYNVLGKEVKTLFNENQNVGKYEINFDASDLSSGVYFYTLNAGNFIETKKMILLR